jgi:hypothetical protein
MKTDNIREEILPENVHENCYDVVLDLCGELNIDISRNELDRVHRVGCVLNRCNSYTNVADDPRPMSVKLISHQSKLKLIKARKNLKGKDVYIREDLTKVNHALHVRKKNCVKKTIVYTVDGVIMERIPGSGKLYRIKTKDDMVTYGLVNKIPAADF